MVREKVITTNQPANQPTYFISTDLGIPLPDKNLSIIDHYKGSDRTFRRLNKHQETAVKNSLEGSFTLIQGPPGEFIYWS